MRVRAGHRWTAIPYSGPLSGKRPRRARRTRVSGRSAPDRVGLGLSVEKARQGASGGVHGRIRPRMECSRLRRLRLPSERRRGLSGSWSHLRPNTGGLPDHISEKCCCSIRSRSLRRPGRVRRYAAATLSAGGCRCIGHQPTFRLSRLPHRSPAARNRAPSRGHESWERKHRSRQPISTSQCGRGSAKNGGWPLRDETRHSGTRCSL